MPASFRKDRFFILTEFESSFAKYGMRLSFRVVVSFCVRFCVEFYFIFIFFWPRHTANERLFLGVFLKLYLFFFFQVALVRFWVALFLSYPNREERERHVDRRRFRVFCFVFTLKLLRWFRMVE